MVMTIITFDFDAPCPAELFGGRGSDMSIIGEGTGSESSTSVVCVKVLCVVTVWSTCEQGSGEVLLRALFDALSSA